MKKISWLLLILLCLLISGCDPQLQESYTVSGRVTRIDDPQQGIEGVTIAFGGASGTAMTDANGNWSKDGLKGSVSVMPAKYHWTFEPKARQVTGKATNADFQGQPSGLAEIRSGRRLACGYHRSVFLRPNGTVWACGYGSYGQLGDGTRTETQPRPVRVLGLESVVDIAATGGYSIALTADGVAWAWGLNNHGVLGNGTDDYRPSAEPVKVAGIDRIAAVAAGGEHSMAIRCDGTVWVWGEDGYRPPGDRAISGPGSRPIQVEGLDGVVDIAAGGRHSMALRNDGTVWTWGSNDRGQLGDGTCTRRSTPIQVSGLKEVTAIAACGNYSMALRYDGTLWAWGYNGDGQLGDGTTKDRSTPARIEGLDGIVDISAALRYCMALKNDGTVWVCGKNIGFLGVETEHPAPTPVRVAGLYRVEAIAAGQVHSLAMKSDGSLWAWGNNFYGELGNGTIERREMPSFIPLF